MIGIGAPTSTGGSVLEGNLGINIDCAVSTSSIGHLPSCPARSQGKGPIVAVGPRTITLPAGLVALEGDYVACGCPPQSNKLMFAQSSVYGGAEQTMQIFQASLPCSIVQSPSPIFPCPMVMSRFLLSQFPGFTLT